MKVLALVHKYPPTHNAGAELMLHTMFRWLRARGHDDIAVAFPGPFHPYTLDGITVGEWPRSDARIYPEARSADILVTHLDCTGRAMRIAQATHRPLIHVVHNDRQLAYHKVNRADLVVFNSAWLADAYRTWAGASIIVRPPVFSVDYADADRPGRDRITLLNLTSAKGAPLFWALAAALPDRKFLAVRGGYGTQVIPRRPPRNVEVLEHTPDVVERVYARTRVLLVPSSYESWGRVAIEAAASGIPVIAHPTPGLLESLAGAGIFVDRGDRTGWSRAIAVLDDPDTYAARSAAMRTRALELDTIHHRELLDFEVALEALIRAYPHKSTEESPAMILNSRKSRCLVCGASACACGPTTSATGPRFLSASGRGLPLNVYRTDRGDFRLNEDAARRRGLLPDGPELPAAAATKVPAEDLEPIRAAYAAATDDARARFLLEAAAVRRIGPDVAAELLGDLLAEPAAPQADEVIPAATDNDPPVGGRIGEVLSWAADDPDRLRLAARAEVAQTKPRPKLLAELAKRLGVPVPDLETV